MFSGQASDRGAQGRQIGSRGGKERVLGAARGGAQERKAHTIKGKHCAGAGVSRQAPAAHGAETCGLESRRSPVLSRPPLQLEAIFPKVYERPAGGAVN